MRCRSSAGIDALTSSVVGAELEARVVEVTTQMTMAYAVGIGDPSCRAVDDGGSSSRSSRDPR